MELKILEPSRQQFAADRRADTVAPNPRMHGIADLALTLSPAPDVKLPHTDHVALDTRCIREPLLR